MSRRVFGPLVLCCVFAACVPPRARVLSAPEQMRESIRLLVAQSAIDYHGAVEGETLGAPLNTGRFYEAHAFQPVWISTEGVLSANVHRLVSFLKKTDQDGLDPADYHYEKIRSLSDEWKRSTLPAGSTVPVSIERTPQEISNFDILLTDAFLTYALHMSMGRRTPEDYDGLWAVPRRRYDLTLALEDALATGNIRQELRCFEPVHPEYLRLKAALARLKRSHPSAPVEDQIMHIRANMDRWRWLPDDLGKRHIIVDITAYRLYAFEGGTRTLSLPVVVGKAEEDAPTPVLSGQMTYLEFSPQWNVPYDIAMNEMLTAIQADPDFIANNNFEVFRLKDGDDAVAVDTATIDWSALSPEKFPYRFRQKSGPDNPLGGVKFMFPNRKNIYIHGTPGMRLFRKKERAYSHGCVRVKNPTPLALFVLHDPEWTKEKIKDAMGKTEPHLVPLIEPVPVYLLYWTVVVDEKNRVQYRKDIYDRDRIFSAPKMMDNGSKNSGG